MWPKQDMLKRKILFHAVWVNFDPLQETESSWSGTNRNTNPK
jgi:hypothetical protein